MRIPIKIFRNNTQLFGNSRKKSDAKENQPGGYFETIPAGDSTKRSNGYFEENIFEVSMTNEELCDKAFEAE